MFDGCSPPRLRGPIAAAALTLALCPTLAAPALGQTGSGDCQPSATDLCLLDDRFRVSVEWEDEPANPFRFLDTPLAGQGNAVDLPGDNRIDGGYFWFFEPDDIELVVKVLDGRSINGHFWVFYGSTTNVEFTLRVVDTQTDTPVEYFSAQGELSVGGDTRAFEETPSGGGQIGAAAAALVPRAVFRPRNGVPSCDDPEVTCVHDGRIAIESALPNFQDPDGPPVPGRPARTTSTSTILYHNLPESLDALVKVIDARSANGRFWIFASTFGLPEGEITVTDRETGVARVFRPDQEGFLATGDRNGFVPDPPEGAWLETGEIPGFRFKVRITGGGGEVATRQEADCIPETLCISGAVPGRSELFTRIVGPKPNGFLQPNLVKFSTSQIEVWIEQLSSGQLNYYELDPATPGSESLAGFFDRTGFEP